MAKLGLQISHQIIKFDDNITFSKDFQICPRPRSNSSPTTVSERSLDVAIGMIVFVDIFVAC